MNFVPVPYLLPNFRHTNRDTTKNLCRVEKTVLFLPCKGITSWVNKKTIEAVWIGKMQTKDALRPIKQPLSRLIKMRSWIIQRPMHA